jgi:hypothetical protein
LGTDFHELAETYALTGKVDFTPYEHKPWITSLRHRFLNFEEWWQNLPLTPNATAHVEAPFRMTVDCKSANTIVGQKKHRDYSMLDPEKEIGGTSDLILHYPDLDAPVTVYDYKTGDQPVPATSTQMLVLGLMASYVFTVRKVNLCVVTVHDNGVWENWHTLTSRDLEVLAANISAALAAPADKPVPGTHCRYCPARATCPAISEAVAELPKGELQGFKFSTQITGADHAAWTANMLPLAEEFVERVRDSLKAWADNNGGVDLGNGVRYEGKDQTERSPSLTNAAMALLKREGLEKVAKRFTSWAMITEAAGKEKGSEIRAAFEENGWINERVKRVYRQRKSK